MCPRWLRCRLSIQPGVRRDGTGARGRRPHGLTAITRGPRYTLRSLARVVSLRGMQRGPLLTRVPAASSSARGTVASQLCFCFHGGGSVAASGAKVGDAPSGGGADARDGRHDHREGESASRLGRRMGGGGESEEGARHSGKRRHETSSPQPPESRRLHLPPHQSDHQSLILLYSQQGENTDKLYKARSNMSPKNRRRARLWSNVCDTRIINV